MPTLFNLYIPTFANISEYITFHSSKVGDASKKSSQLWKTLSAEERAYWDEKGEQDKQRYLREKNAYTGPWQVPYKRAKKNPLAPKRPMSSFLFFSKARRNSIKDEHPNMKNTEISSILGEQWRNATEEERRPHVEKELRERSKYKAAVEEFKREEVARKEEERKTAARIAATATTRRQQTNTMVTSIQNNDMSYRFVQHNTTHNIPDPYMYPTSHISLTNSQFYDPATIHRAPWNVHQASSQDIFKVDSNESGIEFNDNLLSFLDHDGHASVTDF